MKDRKLEIIELGEAGVLILGTLDGSCETNTVNSKTSGADLADFLADFDEDE